jgi:class 3 adenylate cyclase
LEGHTKVAGRSVLIDEDTQRALNDSVQTQALGAAALKGKSAAVEIFAVITDQA